MASALEGLRIVEVGAGKQLAYCGKLLRDLGAEVIKVEPPGGDQLRRHGPFPNDEPGLEQSGLFIYLNGGKRGARLDLGRPEGRAALRALVDEADVLLLGLRPSQALAAGVHPDELLAARPELVIGAASIYGFTGPYAEWLGYPIQAYAGSSIAHRVGDPEREPLNSPLDGADMQHGAQQLAGAVLTALLHEGSRGGRTGDGRTGEARTGEGQLVDVGSMEASSIAIWGHGIGQIVYLGYLTPQRHGPQLSGGVWGVWPTKDGHFAVMTQVPRHWHDFLIGLGDPEWGHDPLVWDLGNANHRRDLTPEQGAELHELLHARLGPLLREWTNADLWELCRRERISCQPVLTIPEVCEADHPNERGWLADAPGPHPPLRVPGRPYHLSATPWQPPGPPPRLDEEPASSWEQPHRQPAPLRLRPGTVIEPNNEGEPLAGLRVLDLGVVWAGPQTVRYLADFGADVVKITTNTRPWRSGVAGGSDPADPMSWEWVLRNRRSVNIDLRHPEGPAMLQRMASVSDVVLENYGSGTAERMGIGYEVLSRDNPGLVMISMPPAGSTGPWSDLVSYGPTLTGLNGMKAVHGYPEDGAVMEEAAELDPIASSYGALAILAAVTQLSHTGEGQHIELAQAQAGFAALAEGVIEWTWNGRDVGPVGNTHRFLAPHGIYPTLGGDQWIAIACDSDAQWQALARAAGRLEWLEREDFATAAGRRAARHAIDAEIGAWTAGEDKRELAERLQAAGVPAFPVLDGMEVIAEPMLRARRAEFERPPEFPADELLNGVGWHLSKTPPRLRRAAPAFGAHNVEVLGEYLGLSEAEVRGLEASGVLA